MTQFKTGLKQIGDRANLTDEKLKKISSTAKKMGAALVASTGVAIAAAYRLASNAGKLGDDLITLSNKTGLTTDQLQELQYAARFVMLK